MLFLHVFLFCCCLTYLSAAVKRYDAQAQNWIGTHSSAALESVADKAGSTGRQAGVADAGAVAEIIYHGPQVQGRERESYLEKVWTFETSKNTLQQGHIYYFIPSSSAKWGPSLQIYELMGTVLIHITTVDQTSFLCFGYGYLLCM